MNESLQQETWKLTQSWLRHDAEHLRDYLVSSVENPRLNAQSMFSRHFLIRALTGQRFVALMEQEYRFVAVMNWLARLLPRLGDQEEQQAILAGLKVRADNAEGIPIPYFVWKIFSGLPAQPNGISIPNYVEQTLNCPYAGPDNTGISDDILNTFQAAWNTVLKDLKIEPGVTASNAEELKVVPHSPISVLEPACGSANDYRFLASYGLGPWIDYHGFDLCSKNVENARALFPGVKFEVGNAFEIAAQDKAFDYCFFHDLLEHLSADGIAAAAKEICRVTKLGICAGFFLMSEMPETIIRPHEDYHWNILSMRQMERLFSRHGFDAQIIHVATFLRQHLSCDYTHNQNAYTFWLRPSEHQNG